MARRRGRCRIGTSGYQYDHWRGRFYPEDVPKREWLAYYAARFESVEINNTFYQLPDASRFDSWREQVGEGFCFALKFSRYGSHMKRLEDPEEPIERFVERARRLGASLGPILVQLPPDWHPDVDRLARFVAATPRDLCWAFEFRDARWLCDDVYAVLRDAGAALCVHDMIEDHPRELTTDWTYLRFHGDHYSGGYTHQRLTAVARRIEALRARGIDVHAYFNNDEAAHAIEDAQKLRRYVEHAAA
jgi:uncharacterized protein YecE (DUF72 family)